MGGAHLDGEDPDLQGRRAAPRQYGTQMTSGRCRTRTLQLWQPDLHRHSTVTVVVQYCPPRRATPSGGGAARAGSAARAGPGSHSARGRGRESEDGAPQPVRLRGRMRPAKRAALGSGRKQGLSVVQEMNGRGCAAGLPVRQVSRSRQGAVGLPARGVDERAWRRISWAAREAAPRRETEVVAYRMATMLITLRDDSDTPACTASCGAHCEARPQAGVLLQATGRWGRSDLMLATTASGLRAAASSRPGKVASLLLGSRHNRR